MDVILQENIEGVGYVGDLLKVANGYARNYLLPRGKAIEANTRNLKALEHLKRVSSHRAQKDIEVFDELGKRISKVSLSFEVQTGKDDKLFGAVTSRDIAEGLLSHGIEVDRRKIQLDHPIKELGALTVPIKLHRDVTVQISLAVVKKGEGEGQTSSSDSEPITDSEPVTEESVQAQGSEVHP